jgi:DNA-binding MarR family transcriptional regulator
MVIHISLIGRNPEHIWDGLKEIIPAEKLYLLHTSNTSKDNFVEIAKKTKEEIQKIFCDTILVEVNAFNMMSVWNAIDKIVTDEMNKDAMLSPKDFAVNVTGGTNMMAAAATIAATLTGCKAYYVYDRRIDKGRKKYTEELPIPPINIIRSLSNSHQKILKAISNSIFEYKGTKQNGVIRNKILQKQLNLKTSTLNSAIKQLKQKGYIETKRGVPVIRTKQQGLDQKSVQIEDILENEMLIKITQLGIIQSKKASYIETIDYE